ncbi:MAG TPA: hypothetical protein VJ802_05425 [Gemmatimonadaceae bacterium]|nr:hypothetical protein [Gemmatimonadaceae bacterium]
MADALEHGVRTEPTGERMYTLECRVSALSHDIRGAEVARERDTIRVPTEHDDPLAPNRFAAITPQRPTAPSPTTATVFPGARGLSAPHDGPMNSCPIRSPTSLCGICW